MCPACQAAPTQAATAGSSSSSSSSRPAAAAASTHCFRRLEAGASTSHTRRNVARRPFSRADQRGTNISHRQHCSVRDWVCDIFDLVATVRGCGGAPYCCATTATQAAGGLCARDEQSYSRSGRRGGRARQVAASELADPCRWHRERARPTTSRRALPCRLLSSAISLSLRRIRVIAYIWASSMFQLAKIPSRASSSDSGRKRAAPSGVPLFRRMRARPTGSVSSEKFCLAFRRAIGMGERVARARQKTLHVPPHPASRSALPPRHSQAKGALLSRWSANQRGPWRLVFGHGARVSPPISELGPRSRF